MYYTRRNVAYAMWFLIALVAAYCGLRLALAYGQADRVLEIAALAIAYSLVSLVANASKIFD
ncbi:hypothetical protein IQ268_28660 [Oculatella sp. LEGE 06141]|uniref:hypothetical protein n=1 Tax=Oculatella sp. LEGE 06141 TaxID=1828648 RepID=UPI001882F996|nr:hypothetical protein [Oculatella sp. LEGE 06141]MBE9182526.1 hypothetical protein [Oculatella sp. LEGE 06141]